MARSPEELCNQALRRIGYAVPIGYMLEGSPAARVAVEVYSQTRDNLMRAADFDFARQAAPLILLKTSPVGGYGLTPWTNAFPPPPWAYEYAYPTECLLVRSVRPTPVAMPEFDPQPNVFVIADDASVTPSKVILTNLSGAQAVYTGRITDPTVWNTSFTEALIDSLATLFQQALGPNADADKERIEEQAQAVGMAVGRRG
jgi:hypothetical protein